MNLPTGIATTPPADTPVPPALATALRSRGLGAASVHPVWRNSVDGLTFSVATGGREHPIDMFAKWNPAGSGESLADEADRLEWLAGRHPAPRVIDLTTVADDEILLTKALPGESAVSQCWRDDPATALRALGAGMRMLHSIPIHDCPYDWGVEHRMRADSIPADAIEEPPPVDRLVICHGDPCAPNALLDERGDFLAHVDLARLGLADRWADLAVVTMSFAWNYRDYDGAIFWDAYGIEPDQHRIDYYRRLWDAQ